MQIEPPRTEQPSCIVDHFERFANLSEREIELLGELERNPRRYPAGCVLIDANTRIEHFFTLRAGWALALRTLEDGKRQVLDIFLPGQILGLREIGFDRTLAEFRTLTDAEACPFPRARLTEVFDAAPRLTDLFFLVLAREQSMLVERVINIGRRNAAQRLAHFLLELKVRLHQPGDEFELPMNQAVVGDALGLSSVHVSRTFRRLRQLGLIDYQSGRVRIRNLDALVEFAGFQRAYLEPTPRWVRGV